MSLSAASRVYVAGHTGLVGSAVLRRLQAEGFATPVTAARTLGCYRRGLELG